MEDADRICEDKWNKRAFNSLLKMIWKTKSTDRRHRCGRLKHGRTEENVTTEALTTVSKLVLSQEDQPQTHTSFNTSGIQRDRSQSTVVRIICCDLGLNFLKCPKSCCAHELTAAIASFTGINVSQDSVATLFRCGGIINKHFIANFPRSVPVKEFLKSVNTWRSYGQKVWWHVFF